ncbi:MAG TPA: arginine repressor [Gammaproteobacteria bacterium]|nr:arginine repressor [Gammaproteobacteria bacterium]
MNDPKHRVPDFNQSQKLLNALKTLLLSGTVSTQAEIKQALQQQGFYINQSKISRLLRRLGAIKVTNQQGESSYSLPREPLLPSAQSSLAQLIIDIAANETLIIIRTNPGSASLIAALLDRQAAELGILGTVAGDDTLFIVPRSIHTIQQTLTAIKKRLYDED